MSFLSSLASYSLKSYAWPKSYVLPETLGVSAQEPLTYMMDPSPHPAVKVYDWIASGQAREFLNNDMQTPSVTWVGQALDYVLQSIWWQRRSEPAKTAQLARHVLSEEQFTYFRDVPGCDHTHQDEIACIPMNIPDNCTSETPVFYYVHFSAKDVSDITGRLKACFKQYIEPCKTHCGYCWDSDEEYSYWYVLNLKYDVKSLDYINRNWEVVAEFANHTSVHKDNLIKGYSESIIHFCEKDSVAFEEKLGIGLGIGGVALCIIGAVGAIKYCNYRTQKNIEREMAKVKVPLKQKDMLETKANLREIGEEAESSNEHTIILEEEDESAIPLEDLSE